MRQTGQPRLTVGDQTTIIHRIAVPAGTMVQVQPLRDTTLVTLSAPPEITREGDSVRIAWQVIVWEAGSHQLVIPGPVLVTLNVPPDTLPDLKIPLQVQSVLPVGVAVESISAKPPQDWLPAQQRSFSPFLTLFPFVLMGLLLLHWWWRRRGPWPVWPVAAESVPLTAGTLEAWLTAGEAQLALRHLQAAMPPGDPQFQSWLAQAERLRYAPVDQRSLEILIRDGWKLLHPGEA